METRNELNPAMMGETLSGAFASGISMGTLGPMLLRLCKRFWISLFDELVSCLVHNNAKKMHWGDVMKAGS